VCDEERLIAKILHFVYHISSLYSNIQHLAKQLRYLSFEFVQRRGTNIVISVSACLSVCPQVSGISQKPRGQLHQFLCMSILSCDLGSVLLWRRCYTLCTSGFVDDVFTYRNGPYGASCVPSRRIDSVTSETTASISIRICSTLRPASTHCGDEVCYLQWPCFFSL